MKKKKACLLFTGALLLSGLGLGFMGVAPYDHIWTELVRELLAPIGFLEAFKPIYHPVARAYLQRPITIWLVKFLFFLERLSPSLVFLVKSLLLSWFGIAVFLFFCKDFGARKSFLSALLTQAMPVTLLSTWWPVEPDVLGGALLFTSLVALRKAYAQNALTKTVSFLLLALTLSIKETMVVPAAVVLLIYLRFLTGRREKKFLINAFFFFFGAAALLYLPALFQSLQTSPQRSGLEALTGPLKILQLLASLLLHKLGVVPEWTFDPRALDYALRIPFSLYHNMLQLLAAPIWPLPLLFMTSVFYEHLKGWLKSALTWLGLLAILLPSPWQSFDFVGAYFLDPFWLSLLLTMLLFATLLLDGKNRSSSTQLPSLVMLGSVLFFFLVPLLILFWRMDVSARIYIPLFPFLNMAIVAQGFDWLQSIRKENLFLRWAQPLAILVIAWSVFTRTMNFRTSYITFSRTESVSRKALIQFSHQSSAVFFTHYIFRVTPDYLEKKSHRQPAILISPKLHPDSQAEHTQNLCAKWSLLGRPDGEVLIYGLYTRALNPEKKKIAFRWLRTGYDYLQTGRPLVYRDFSLPEMTYRVKYSHKIGLEKTLEEKGERLFLKKVYFSLIPEHPLLAFSLFIQKKELFKKRFHEGEIYRIQLKPYCRRVR